MEYTSIMAIDKEEIIKQLQEMAKNAKAPECPKFFEDERLEDAFKTPVCNEEGYSEPIPAIWNDYSYGKDEDGVLILTSQSASIVSRQYSMYLDEAALVWDSNQERLFLYVPDPDQPKMAFKGSSWHFAKRLKPEYRISFALKDVYLEFLSQNNTPQTNC